LAPGGQELLQFGEAEFFQIRGVSHGRISGQWPVISG
jgi:hypothetical protein